MTLIEILENTEHAITSEKENLEDYVYDVIRIASESIYNNEIITSNELKCINELLYTINSYREDDKNKNTYLFGQLYSILQLLKQIESYQAEDFIIRDILPLSNDMIYFLEAIEDESIEFHKMPISWQNYIEWLDDRKILRSRNLSFFIKRKAGNSKYYSLSLFGKRLLEKAKEEQQNAINA